jgi:hypothetical protein
MRSAIWAANLGCLRGMGGVLCVKWLNTGDWPGKHLKNSRVSFKWEVGAAVGKVPQKIFHPDNQVYVTKPLRQWDSQLLLSVS